MPAARRSVFERIWEKVAFPDGAEATRACWLWSGALSQKRRNQMRPVIWDGRTAASVARIVCADFHGPPPTSEHEAGHTCPDGENHKCVSPWHLRWMTRTENEQYKQERRAERVAEARSALS